MVVHTLPLAAKLSVIEPPMLANTCIESEIVKLLNVNATTKPLPVSLALNEIEPLMAAVVPDNTHSENVIAPDVALGSSGTVTVPDEQKLASTNAIRAPSRLDLNKPLATLTAVVNGVPSTPEFVPVNVPVMASLRGRAAILQKRFRSLH